MATREKTLVVSERGQITLPAGIRKRFGLRPGGMVTLEERRGELVLKPAAIVELQIYSEEEVVRWNEEDELSASERRRLSEKLRKKKR